MQGSAPFFGIPPLYVVLVIIAILIIVSRFIMGKRAEGIIAALKASGANIQFATAVIMSGGFLSKRGLLVLLDDRITFAPFSGKQRIDISFGEISRIKETGPGLAQMGSHEKNQRKLIFELVGNKYDFMIHQNDSRAWQKILSEHAQLKDKIASI